MDGITAMAKLREFSNIPGDPAHSKIRGFRQDPGVERGRGRLQSQSPSTPWKAPARVKSQLRRFLQLGAAVKAPSVISVGGIELDHDAKRVTLDGEPVALTPKEYDILDGILHAAPRQGLYARGARSAGAWNLRPRSGSTTPWRYTSAICARSWRSDPSNPRYLKVVWGKGYKLEGGRQ